MNSRPQYSLENVRRTIECNPLTFVQEWEQAEAAGALDTPRYFSQLFFLAARACAVDSKRNKERVYEFDKRNVIRTFFMDRLPNSVRTLQSSGHRPTIKDLTQLIGAFDILALSPTQRWQHYLLKNLSFRFKEMDGMAAVKFVRSLREFAVYPGDEWVSLWWDQASELLDDIGDNGLDDIIYSLAVLDCLRGLDGRSGQESPCREIGMLLLDIHANHFDRFFPDSVMRQQIYDAALWFDNKRLLGKGFLEPYRDTTKGKCEAYYKREFAQVGVSAHDFRIGRMWHQSDMRLQFQQASAGLHLFEADGRYHFTSDLDRRSVRYNGMTIFRTTLMEKVLHGQDAVIMRVPDYPLREFNYIGLKEIVENLQLRMPDLAAGAYVMQGLDDFVPISNKEAWVVPTLRRDEIFRPV